MPYIVTTLPGTGHAFDSEDEARGVRDALRQVAECDCAECRA